MHNVSIIFVEGVLIVFIFFTNSFINFVRYFALFAGRFQFLLASKA